MRVIDAASAVARKLDKPLLIGEYGLHPATDPTGLTNNHRVVVMRTVTDAVISSAVNGGPVAGALIWQIVHDGFRGGMKDFDIGDLAGRHKREADLMRDAATRIRR